MQNPTQDSIPARPGSAGTIRAGRIWSPRLVSWVLILILIAEVSSMQTLVPLLALPDILGHYQTDQAAWITAAFALSGAIWSPIMGKAADIYGKKRIMLFTLLLAAIGAFICAFAPNFAILLVGRVLAGAVIATTAIGASLIRQTFPPKAVPLSIGLMASGGGIIGVVLPYAITAIIAQSDWRAVFWAPAIWSLFLFIVGLIVLRESPVRAPGTINWLEGLTLGAGIGGVLAGVSLGPSWGWASLATWGVMIAGAVLLIVWWLMSRRSSNPLIDLKYFRQRDLALTLLAMLFFGMFGATFFLSVTFVAATASSAGLGYGSDDPAATNSLAFAVWVFLIFIGGILSGLLSSRRLGISRTLVLALFVALAGAILTGALAGVTVGFFAGIVVAAIGLGMANGVAFNLVLSMVKPEVQAVVSSMVMIMFTLAASIGPVVLVAVLSSGFQVEAGLAVYSRAGIAVAFLFPAVSAAIAIALMFAVLAVQRRQQSAPVDAAAVAEEAAAVGTD